MQCTRDASIGAQCHSVVTAKTDRRAATGYEAHRANLDSCRTGTLWTSLSRVLRNLISAYENAGATEKVAELNELQQILTEESKE